MTVPDTRAGTRGSCPRCKQAVQVPLSDELPAKLRGASDEGWEEVQFEDKPTAGVAVPVDDDDAPMAELAEPLSPADFAAEKSASKPEDVKAAKFAEPLSPGDFAFEHKKPVAKDEPLSPADFAVRKSASKKSKPQAEPPPAAAAKTKPVAEPEVEVPLTIEDEPQDGRDFRLDQSSLRKVYLLAIVEALATVFVAFPVIEHLGIIGAPPWAWVVIGLVTLQAVYVLWVVSLPDWSTVWFGVLVFGLTSMVHLVGFVLSFFLANKNLLGITTGNWITPLWCGTVVIITAAMAFGCLFISRPWREEYEAYKAGTAR